MQGPPAPISFSWGINRPCKLSSGGRLNVLSIPETPATGGRRPQRRHPEESGARPSRGSGALAGSAAPRRLGPAAPHGGGRPLGRRPSLPHWGGSVSLPPSLDLAPASGPHLVPGHGCGSSGLGTDGKSDRSAPGPGFSVAPADTSPTTALGSCISEREQHPALSSQELEMRLRRDRQGAGAQRSRPSALRLAQVTRRRRGDRQAGTCSPPRRGGR